MNTQRITRMLPCFRRESRVKVETVGWISFALSLMTGATSTPLAKELTTAFSPLSMVFLTEFSVLCFTVLSFGFLPLLHGLLRLRRKHMLPLVVFSVANGVIAPMFMFNGLKTTSAVNAELFARSQTLFLLLFAVVFLKEVLRKEHVFAAGIVIAGVTLIALQGFALDVSLNHGDGLIILAASMYATGISVLKKYLHDVHPELSLFFRGVVALTFFFVSSPFLNHTFVQEFSSVPNTLFSVVMAYGFLSCFLSVFCFYEAVERLEAHTISVGLPLMSIGSIVMANVYLGETLTWYHITGAVLLISGTIGMQIADRVHNAKMHLPPSHYQRH